MASKSTNYKSIERAPQPSRILFDPYNSSSTGHQRDKSLLSGSTAWRDSRSQKLAQQFGDTSGGGGKHHISDTVGAGSANFELNGKDDNGSRQPDRSMSRERGCQDIALMMNRSTKRKIDGVVTDGECGNVRKKNASAKQGSFSPPSKILRTTPPPAPVSASDRSSHVPDKSVVPPAPDVPSPSSHIFRGLNIYINGSTLSSGISDHRLRNLFVQNGGSVSIALGRRTVTHVILGSEKCLLAAGKIQKEVSKHRGKGIKYVTAQWITDSVENKRRLPEGKYAARLMKGQRSMLREVSGKST